MKPFPFGQLGSPEEFQQLCAELVEAEGGRNTRGHGVGADQGCDFLVDMDEVSPLGSRKRTYLVQCKWRPSKKSVGQSAVSEALSSLAVHGADGLLLLTDSKLSGTAATKINAFNRARMDPLAALFWDGPELSKRLWKHPEVADRLRSRASQLPVYREHAVESLAELSFDIPQRYASLKVESFPLRESEDRLRTELERVVALLVEKRAHVLVISGAVGAGKTGLACGLASLLAARKDSVIFLASYEYSRLLFYFHHHKDQRYLDLLARLEAADCLVVDDFGQYLWDESEGQIFAAKCLLQVLEVRRRTGRPTLLPVYFEPDRIGAITSNYLEWIRTTQAAIRLGAESRRRPGVVASLSRARGAVLGRGWLEEKLGNVRASLERALEVCATPEEVHLGQQRRLASLLGVRPQGKLDEIREILAENSEALRRYEEFIDGLNFERIFFSNDGAVEVVPRGGRGSQ